jgi:hypothetical protein
LAVLPALLADLEDLAVVVDDRHEVGDAALELHREARVGVGVAPHADQGLTVAADRVAGEPRRLWWRRR